MNKQISTSQIAVIGAVLGLAVLAFIFRAQLTSLINRSGTGTDLPDIGGGGEQNGAVSLGTLGEASVNVRGY